MPKNKEYTENGVREFYSVKGCNNCYDCQNLVSSQSQFSTVYNCKAKKGKTSIFDRRFPYDNTKCKDFKKTNE